MPSLAKQITYHLSYKMNYKIFRETFNTRGAASARKEELCNFGAVEWVMILPVAR